MVRPKGWSYRHLNIPEPKYDYDVVIRVRLHNPIQETPLLPNAIKSKVSNGITQHLRHCYDRAFEYRNITVKLDHIVDLNKKEKAP